MFSLCSTSETTFQWALTTKLSPPNGILAFVPAKNGLPETQPPSIIEIGQSLRKTFFNVYAPWVREALAVDKEMIEAKLRGNDAVVILTQATEGISREIALFLSERAAAMGIGSAVIAVSYFTRSKKSPTSAIEWFGALSSHMTHIDCASLLEFSPKDLVWKDAWEIILTAIHQATREVCEQLASSSSGEIETLTQTPQGGDYLRMAYTSWQVAKQAGIEC